MASNTNVSITGPLTIRVVDAQTSAENGRKFTKYKVTVSYNNHEWEIWRRYKEFHTLNEKVRNNFNFKIIFFFFNFLFSFCSFVVFVLI